MCIKILLKGHFLKKFMVGLEIPRQGSLSVLLKAQASLAPTPVSPSVSLSHFQISVLSASLRPYKASRQHCGGRHGG